MSCLQMHESSSHRDDDFFLLQILKSPAKQSVTGNGCPDIGPARVRYTQWNMHHDDVIKWKHFPRSWSFVRGIHRSPVNSPHKGQWRGALMFSLMCAWINRWVNNREAGDLRRHRAHYDVTVMARLLCFVLLWSYCWTLRDLCDRFTIFIRVAPLPLKQPRRGREIVQSSCHVHYFGIYSVKKPTIQPIETECKYMLHLVI